MIYFRTIAWSSELTWNTFRNHLILEYEIPKYDGDSGPLTSFVSLDESTCRRKIDNSPCFSKPEREKHWFSRESFFSIFETAWNGGKWLQRLRGGSLLPKGSFRTRRFDEHLVTGHTGYIGAVLVPMLLKANHEVTGLEIHFFAGCEFNGDLADVPAIRKDLRDVIAADLNGFDAVIHLAALSNHPLSDLNPECTYEINHRALVRLAELAKMAGVPDSFFFSVQSIWSSRWSRLPH